MTHLGINKDSRVYILDDPHGNSFVMNARWSTAALVAVMGSVIAKRTPSLEQFILNNGG